MLGSQGPCSSLIHPLAERMVPVNQMMAGAPEMYKAPSSQAGIPLPSYQSAIIRH